MINILRLVRDLYDDRELIDSRLRAFADDHLIRLANNNPGNVYDPLITATTTVYTAYYGSMTNEAVKEAITEGLTIATDNAAKAVIAKLSSQQNLVAYNFGKDSTIYQEFFPLGMDEYHQARIDDLGTLLDRYIAAATTHLTPAQAGEVSTLATAFTNARTAQRNAFSETDTLRTGRREARKALTLQLTRNTLALASDFLDNQDGFDDYFDLTLLPISSSDSEPVASGTVIISWVVIHAATGNPIGNARVWANNAEGLIETFTGSDGRYELEVEDVEETFSADLSAGAAGFGIQSRSITIEPGEDQTQDFGLSPMP